MALNGKLQAPAAFEDAADIGATAQHLGHQEEGHRLQMRFAKYVRSVISFLRPKKRFLLQTDPNVVLVHTREALLLSWTSRHLPPSTTLMTIPKSIFKQNEVPLS